MTRHIRGRGREGKRSPPAHSQTATGTPEVRGGGRGRAGADIQKFISGSKTNGQTHLRRGEGKERWSSFVKLGGVRLVGSR